MPQKCTSQRAPNFNERNERDTVISQLASIVESSGDANFGETFSLISPSDRHKEVVKIAARLILINDVLDLTKIDESRMVVNYSQEDVRELLTSALDCHRQRVDSAAGRKGTGI